MIPMEKASSFLAGEVLTFVEADTLWKELLRTGRLSAARAVLQRLRGNGTLSERLPASRPVREELCRKEAMLTSKDLELGVTVRHDRAIDILSEELDLNDEALDGETLGVAAGIYKRKWFDLGQLSDLRCAAELYGRGARGSLGTDAHAQINAAFAEDLLAHAGDDPVERNKRADVLRMRIKEELTPDPSNWWNVASRAEALFGLGDYEAAAQAVAAATPDAIKACEPWQRETTARQLATLAHMRESQPFQNTQVRGFFETLLPGAVAVRSAFVGKVGLALSSFERHLHARSD